MLLVKDSLIKNARLGVFAKEIKRGQVVCYYDGEDIPMNSNIFEAYTIIHPTLPGVCRKGYDKPRTIKGVGEFIHDCAMSNWNGQCIKNLLTDNMDINPIGAQRLEKELRRYQKQRNANKTLHLSMIDLILSRQNILNHVKNYILLMNMVIELIIHKIGLKVLLQEYLLMWHSVTSKWVIMSMV